MSVDRVERLQIMLDPRELKALDDWRFAKRMPSRAAAVREIIRRGLAAEGFDTAPAGQSSAAFGVLDGIASEEAAKADGSRRGQPAK
jgi:hypothetical protein